MEFDYTEEQQIFRRTIRDFAEKEVAPLVDDAEKNEKFPSDLLPKLGELGYLGVVYPTEYGGAGAGKVEECIFVEELGRVCVGITGGIMIQSGMATSSIFDYGSDYLKQEYLVPAIKGNKIAAFALSEPNAGSDVASIECKAIEDGDSYVIGGNKTYISNGPIADFVLTAAYTDKSKGSNGGISLFVVDTKLPGFSARKMHKFCLRSSETGELHYDNVRVPKENCLLGEGRGFEISQGRLGPGRIHHCMRSIGQAERALDLMVRRGMSREAFGRPLIQLGKNLELVSRARIDIEAMRLMVLKSAKAMDVLGNREARVWVHMIKAMIPERVCNIIDQAIQIHGASGVSQWTPLAGMYTGQRTLRIADGPDEVHHLVVGRAEIRKYDENYGRQ